MRFEVLTGIILIVLGVLFILLGIVPRLIESVPKLHPLLYTQVSLGELRVGTSPIVIIVLIILYLILAFRGNQFY